MLTYVFTEGYWDPNLAAEMEPPKSRLIFVGPFPALLRKGDEIYIKGSSLVEKVKSSSYDLKNQSQQLIILGDPDERFYPTLCPETGLPL